MKPLILASASPRRSALLQMLGFRFSVEPSHINEDLPEEVGPVEHVRLISQRKAEAIASRHADGIILGADTIVVLDGEVLGKPADAAEAAAMLHRLSGRTHRVFTGVTLIDAANGRTATDSELTEVRIRSLSPDDIQRYAVGPEPLDKAGGYAAQGRAAIFIESVTGCFYNVVGLPLALVWDMMGRIGQRPWDRLDGGGNHSVNLVTQDSPRGA